MEAIEFYILAVIISFIMAVLGLGIGLLSSNYLFVYLGLGFILGILVLNIIQGAYYLLKEEYNDYKNNK